MSVELIEVLSILHEAGARDVPAGDIAWTEEMAGTVFHALNMAYIRRRETADGNHFSLTESGYRAIGKRAPRDMSVMGALRSAFRWIGTPIDP